MVDSFEQFERPEGIYLLNHSVGVPPASLQAHLKVLHADSPRGSAASAGKRPVIDLRGRHLRLAVAALAVVLLATACGSDESGELDASQPATEVQAPASAVPATTSPPVQNLPRRTYSLGFTPFPSDLTAEAVTTAHDQLATNGDLFAFHTTEGVPWTEALAGSDVDGYGSGLRKKFEEHRAVIDANPGHEVYLGLTPLDDGRSRLADYWGESDHMAIPALFDTLAFDDPKVVTAYTNFVLTAVDFYQPDYLAIGIEVNLLVNNSPEQFPALVSLLSQTYAEVKAQHPNLPIFSTVTAVDILPGWTDSDDAAQADALSQILESSDYLALSFYPFMSNYLTNPIPGDTWDELANRAAGRPIAIAETGYPAQVTDLPTFDLTFDGTAEKQQAWIQQMLDAADTYSMPFVVNFVSQDYDALWEKVGSTDLFAIWRDTGLVDENGADRPALATWRDALARPRN